MELLAMLGDGMGGGADAARRAGAGGLTLLLDTEWGGAFMLQAIIAICLIIAFCYGLLVSEALRKVFAGIIKLIALAGLALYPAESRGAQELHSRAALRPACR
jgi:hypothetical protein